MMKKLHCVMDAKSNFLQEWQSVGTLNMVMIMDKIGCINNTIITSTGLYFDYGNPLPEQINIKDIAKSLSNTCRYGGHCDFYSVAEHSVNCVILANNEGLGHGILMHILMHDAQEAYIGDMPKPLKIMMPEFQRLEEWIEKAVRSKFDISNDYEKIIKKFDLQMLKAEKRYLFPDDKELWFGFDLIEDVNIEINCLSPSEAEKRFIGAFNQLSLNDDLQVL